MLYLKKVKYVLFLFLLLLSYLFYRDTLFNDLNRLKKSYAKIVYLTYSDSLKEALKLQESIKQFLNNPNEDTFENAKAQWIKSRVPYGETEAFRFLGGPIDIDEKTGKEGPEGSLNSWPVNESYIDYVKGKPKSGIVNSDINLDGVNLRTINGEGDESNIAIGYHAIEFLLWGQDFYDNSAGQRSFIDYLDVGVNHRRRQYLTLVVNLLVEDLQTLVKAWDSNIQDSFYWSFMDWTEEEFFSKVLSSLATFSGFELASERMSTALMSGEQEDEHSCFSDNTHNDFIANQQGIMNIFFAKYKDYNGFGLVDYFAKNSSFLNAKLVGQLEGSMNSLRSLPHPIDKILSSKDDSIEKESFRLAIKGLNNQAHLFIRIGSENKYKVSISGE